MLHHIIEHLKTLGMIEVRLHVSLGNTTALCFWVKEGFNRIVKVQCKGNLLPGAFAGIELHSIFQPEKDEHPVGTPAKQGIR